MNIALVMEWSTSERNAVVSETLKKVAEAKGHSVVNYGQFDMEDARQTYNQNAVFIAALLAGKAADFVVTGCGTGEGAMLAANAMPGVVCGLVVDPADSYLFTQVNGGNCMSLPFAKGWGWGAEVNLEYVFEKLFVKEPGGGYPAHAAESEKRNAYLLNQLKGASHHTLEEILTTQDAEVREIIRAAFAGRRMELFKEHCQDKTLQALIEKEVS